MISAVCLTLLILRKWCRRPLNALSLRCWIRIGLIFAGCLPFALRILLPRRCVPLILRRFSVGVLASRRSNFGRQLIGQVLNFLFRSTKRFCLAAKNRVGRLFDAFGQIFDALASNLFGLLRLIPQAAADQDFCRL